MSTIIHRGTVTAVHDDYITVNIAPEHDCDGCAISRLCSRSETIDVPLSHPDPSMVGEEISVGITARDHRLAVLLLLVVPIVILIAVIAVCVMFLDLSEGLASLIALALLALWYMVMWLIRYRFNSTIKCWTTANADKH